MRTVAATLALAALALCGAEARAQPGPSTTDCGAWDPIVRAAYRSFKKGHDRSALVQVSIDDAKKQGWPEESAKHLLVIILDAYQGAARDEERFAAEELTKCRIAMAAPGPKYANVTVSGYTDNISSAMAGPKIEEKAILFDDSPQSKELIGRLVEIVRSFNFACETVSAARPMFMTRGFVLTCNKFSYTYDIRDMGGRWQVAPQ